MADYYRPWFGKMYIARYEMLNPQVVVKGEMALLTYNLVRVMTEGGAIGPILMGRDKPAHILTPASTPRRVVNITAIAAVDAKIRASSAQGTHAP